MVASGVAWTVFAAEVGEGFPFAGGAVYCSGRLGSRGGRCGGRGSMGGGGFFVEGGGERVE